MVRVIVRRHQFRQSLDILVAVGGREIFVHLGLERPIESFHHTGFRFILSREETNIMLLEKSLEGSIGKLCAFIGLQGFRFSPACKNCGETINE